MAKVDKDTQTRLWNQNRDKARHSEKLKTTTGKIMKFMTDLIKDIGLVEKLDIAADDAHKAYVQTQKMSAYQEKLAKAEMRSLAARSSTFKSNIEE